MKKKILSIALVVCLLATALVSGTLAYFTDTDEAKNVFTVGNLSIELKEEAKVVDGKGDDVTADKVTGDEDAGYTYNNVMPGNVITKKPTITNDDTIDAYVRVVVTMNNAKKINEAIDEVYEGKGLTADQVQAIYDEVFTGWGINYNPRPNANGKNDARGIIEAHTDSKVLKVDFTKTAEAGSTEGHSIFGIENWFMSELEKAAADAGKYEIRPDGAFAGYYTDGMEDMEIRYVYYIDLKAGESVTLFDGLKVPTDFDTNVDGINQMAMFENLTIDIDVAAIQQEGFATPQDAFEALQAAHAIQ